VNTAPLRTISAPRAAAIAACLGALALGACTSTPKNIETPDPPAAPSAVDRIARARSLADEANRAQSAGHIDEAIRLNQQAIVEYADFAAAWNNLGVLYMDRDQNLEAANAFQRAGELSPNDPRFPYNIGVIWWRLGYGEDAAKQFNAALDRDPNYLPALKYSIQWDIRRGQPTEDTAERLRRALLAEHDTTTREWLQRQQLLVNETLAKHPPNGVPPASGPSMPPPATAEVAPGRP
jgi:tetratricopeptide (TPR) repeat protein